LTGVPGAGKTLAGLNIANERLKADESEHSVFLSGNGPLVDVLREALTRDSVESAKKVAREFHVQRLNEKPRLLFKIFIILEMII
jgi:SpoVK/Ycf46/Vps4 family AAA+-type ATPase